MATVKAEEQFVTVNGVRLRYLDWGTSGRPAMVCLHGHTGQAHIWDEFAEAMSPSYHVYAVDQRGHGGSEWAGNGYERDRFVEDLGAFLDALSIQRATLVGLSMGGWNSLLYAAEHPDRVDRIVLVDIAPEPSEESKQQWGDRPPTPLEFDSFDEAYRWAREGNPWAGDDRLRADVEAKIRRRDDGKWTWKADSALFNTRLRDNEEEQLQRRYWRAMEVIPCPILEVRGLESPLVSDAILERMKQANARFGWVDIADAGHVVTVDKPREFIAATRAFLGVPG